MCGIAGHIGPAQLPPERIQRTLASMRHRGPDDRSHKRFETPAGHHVDLLHGRLSIIDLDERSNQPFKSGSTWLSFNGELYNYIEVRDRLGGDFRTAGDTEVLATALDRQGWDALDGCEGMWAFATYDERTGVLGLSRDRFGEKPLYIYRDGDDLYFGSEVKFIVGLLGRPLPVNHRHLRRYLVNGYKSLYKTHETFFEGLTELPPGSWLERGPGTDEHEGRYWSPSRPASNEPLLRGGRRGHTRAPDPLGRAAPARRRPARLLHVGRRGLDVAHLDREERLRLRRARLHDRQRGRALRGVGDGRVREGDARRPAHRDPHRHRRLPPEAPAARAPPRRAALHHHLLRPVAADGVDPRARLPDLDQRHGRGRAVLRLLRPSPRLSPRHPRRARAVRALGRELARAHRADRAQPVPPGPLLLRRGLVAARPHLPRRRRSSRGTSRSRSTSPSRSATTRTRCSSTACTTSSSTSRCR